MTGGDKYASSRKQGYNNHSSWRSQIHKQTKAELLVYVSHVLYYFKMNLPKYLIVGTQ